MSEKIPIPDDVRDWLENSLSDDIPKELKAFLAEVLTNGFEFQSDLEIVRSYMRRP